MAAIDPVVERRAGVPLRMIAPKLWNMWTLIIILLIIWLAFSVLGFAVKGLLWLAVIGIILFVVTAIFGWFRRAGSSK